MYLIYYSSDNITLIPSTPTIARNYFNAFDHKMKNLQVSVAYGTPSR